MQQVERGTSATISARFIDGDTVVTAVTATLGIVDADNAQIVAPGTGASADGDGWSYLLGPQPESALLTATWRGVDAESNVWQTVQTIEVVGGFYFDLPELRDMPEVVDSGTRYSSSDLVEARQFAEATIDQICDTSFVERFHQDDLTTWSFWRYGSFVLNEDYPQKLLSVTIDGTNISDGDLAVLTFLRNAIVTKAPHAWPSVIIAGIWTNATASYVGGYSRAPTKDLKTASLVIARDFLISMKSDAEIAAGMLQPSDPDHPTGLAGADGPLVRWRNRVNVATFA